MTKVLISVSVKFPKRS